MLVTKLAQNKNPFLVDVYLDDNFFKTVDKNFIVEYQLYKGKNLDQKEVENLQDAGIVNKLYNLALNRIVARPRSVAETRKYMLGKVMQEEDKGSIELAIEKLLKMGYLNDSEFALWWIDNRNTFKAKSKRELSFELQLKGLSKEVIQAVLAETMDSDQEAENIAKTAEKKWQELQNKDLSDKERRDKLIIFLQRKGFAWDMINTTLKNII